MKKKKKEKKKNFKSRPFIQTLVYKSNIYYSKIDQKGNWKNNGSALHLDMCASYFRNLEIDTQLNSLELKGI